MGSKVDPDFKAVLRRLWQGGNYAYWWSLPSKESVWFAVDGDWPPLPDLSGEVYFGVHPTSELPSRNGKSPAFLRAKDEDITVLNCLYADFDVKADPSDGLAFSIQRAATLAYIQGLKPAPSVVWSSGGGYQAVWLLVAGWALSSPDNREHARRVQKAFVDQLELADAGAKDLTRVLRTVGSWNHKPKYPGPLPVELVWSELRQTYTLDELVPGWVDLGAPAVVAGAVIPATAVTGRWLDVEAYLQHHGLRFKAVIRDDFTEYQFAACPMNDHGLDDSRHFLMQYNTGKLGFQCFHGSCDTVGWQEFKDKYSAKGFWLNRAYNGRSVPLAPQDPKPFDYINGLTALGFSFSINEMNDRLYANNILMSDPLSAYLVTELRNAGYPSKQIFADTVLSEGYRRQFHPIREYMEAVEWDGQDHITDLCTYVTDKDALFPVLQRKWLLAAVERILEPKAECQPPVLLMVGPQGLGKSVYTDFLGSALPAFTVHSDVKPEDKDYKILAISKFVWEVKEMESVFKRAEVGRLKAFFDAHTHTVRAPYGHYDITKPTTACFIGTVNDNGAGFLNDPTGSRRYWSMRITGINFGYKQVINIDQVWAQAVALYRRGERYLLDKDTQVKVYEVNDIFTSEDPLEPYIQQFFEITQDTKDYIASNAVQTTLHGYGLLRSATDHAETTRIATIIRKMGATSDRMRDSNKKQFRIWRGVRARSGRPPMTTELGFNGFELEK